MPICALEDATKTYEQGSALVHALDDVTLSFDAGEYTVISGPSGSGETTLLNMVGLLDTLTSGRVTVEGRDVSNLSSRELAGIRARRIGFIFQSFNLIPVLSALENVEMALHLSHAQPIDGGGSKRQRATRILEEVGLGAMLKRRPNQLSGGQQQRVAIARALVKKPALVIADEPTANLDSETGGEILDIMRRMNEEHGATFLFSTHDPLVMEQARRVVSLKDGRIESDERRGPSTAAGHDVAESGEADPSATDFIEGR